MTPHPVCFPLSQLGFHANCHITLLFRRSHSMFAPEPAFYYDFADAALVMIEASDIAEGQELISVKDFRTYLEGKGYSSDR